MLLKSDHFVPVFQDGIAKMKKSNKFAKTTIIDIAKASGVSVSTVSRILNDKPDVAEETRERVLSIIKDYQFRASGSLATTQIREKSFHHPALP